MSRLVLIDGSSYLYRAFHALPPLTAPDGTPTGALHGIVSMLRATLKENPDYAAFVVDAPGPTFRDALFPAYKAQRPPMPEDLRAQIEPMLAIVQALGFPLLRESGVEADDVIGTLALQAHALGIPVTISTGDKDFAQLVRPGITLTNTMSNTVMDEAGVFEKFGVRPDQVIDLLALMGDSVDNIPGVDKCGPKTAAKWLAEYGTLAAVMAHSDQIGGKIGENLRAALPRLPLNEQLVTIKTDCVLPVTATQLQLKPRDVEALRELYTRYGFRQALAELNGGAPAASGSATGSRKPATSAPAEEAPLDPALSQAGQYECITTMAQLDDWIARLQKAELIAFDTETDALDPMRANLVGLSFAVETGQACYIPVGHCVATPTSLRSVGHCVTTPTSLRSVGHCVATPTSSAAPSLRSVGHCVATPTSSAAPSLRSVGHRAPKASAKAPSLLPEEQAAEAPGQLPMATVLARLKPLLEDPCKKKLGQHGKYDLHVLRRHGISVQGYAEDTMLESFVWQAGLLRHDMDSLASRFLGYQTIKYEDVTGKGAKQISFAEVDLDTATRYAAEDADITLRLHRVLSAKLAAEPALQRVYRDIEMPLVPVLESIEYTGVLIDVAELKRQSADLSQRMLAIQQRAYEIAGRSFNLDSPKQLGALLFDELKLPALVKTPGGAPSTNEEALEAISDQHELPRLILDHRGLAKLRSTYTDKLPEMVNPDTGRVHTSYHQAGAATGRLSSSDPNLQNIPIRSEDGRRIRRAFVAPPGRKIVACDYSQIELRIMAHLSEDPGLLRAFESGADVHRATASEVFAVPLAEVSGEQRRAAKAINFGLMYGMSAFGLARQLGIGRGEAQDYIALYFSRYPGVREYMERVRQQAREQGYVETVFGRRLYLGEIHSRNQAQRAGAERAAINAPMQGTAADIIKRAMVDVHGWLAGQRERALMIMQVHDELVFEVDLDFAQTLIDAVKTRMAAAATLKVALVVDAGIGDNWDEAH